MVCPRCISAVQSALEDSDIEFTTVELGRVTLKNAVGAYKLSILEKKLKNLGFARIESPDAQLINLIKQALLEYLQLIEDGQEVPKKSEYLSSKLFKNYSYLSERFTSVEGRPLEQFWISMKTERARELLETGEHSITEIAHQLGYSSSQYFANQFRRQTGFSPSQWKKNREKRTGRQST